MKKLKTIAVVLAVILGAILFLGFSWITTCGIIKLITMCFGWTFKWSIATGIWLVIYFIIQPIFDGLRNSNNNEAKELKEIKNILRFK